MASPVAGLFLVVVGAAYLVGRDRVRAAVLLLPPAVVVGATTLLFPFSGEQLMPAGRIGPPVLLGLTVAVLAPRGWRVARWSGVVYAAGTVLTYLIPSPVGTNVERFAELFAPAVLLAVLLGAPRLKPLRRTALIAALCYSLFWVGQKTVDDLEVSTNVPAWAADTQGVVTALDRLGADRTRVEVVPARNHREATALAPHVNLARGWNRQLDIERGRLFYDGTFSAATYRAWLDHWAVGLVVLPGGKPDGFAEEEARLVQHPPAWLEPVWSDAHWQVFRVRDAAPLVSAPASVVRTTSAAGRRAGAEARLGDRAGRVLAVAARRRGLPHAGRRVHAADGLPAGRVPDQLRIRSVAGTGSFVLTSTGFISVRGRGPWSRYVSPKPAPTTIAPPTASRIQWLPVATIAEAVKNGCSRPSAFIHHFGARIAITSPHHSDQPKCSEGIAAYWFVSAVSVP